MIEMSLLKLLEEYRENKIDDVGYDVAIKLAEIESYLTEEERQSKIDKFKRKREISIRKLELVDKYDFESIFTERQIKIIKEIFFNGSRVKDIDWMDRETLKFFLMKIKKRLKRINIILLD